MSSFFDSQRYHNQLIKSDPQREIRTTNLFVCQSRTTERAKEYSFNC